jgi:hypothetical protein
MEKAISQNSTSIYNTQKDSTEPKYAIPNNKKLMLQCCRLYMT